MKGVMRFGRKVNLSPRYVRPYEVLQRIVMVAYELKLPSELVSVNSAIQISMLKKCTSDLAFVLPMVGLGVYENLSYEDVPVDILDDQVKMLRNKELSSVKVLWRNHLVEGVTWEAEADMKSCYPKVRDSS